MKLTIGEKIALLRKEKNITQTELAEYLSLAPQTISRWEVGNGAPEISLLPKIATFFSVGIDDLFGLTSLTRAEDLVWKYTHIPRILEICTEQDEFEFLMSLLELYRKENQEEKLAAVKKRLLALLPRQSMNQYFLERAKTTIEQS